MAKQMQYSSIPETMNISNGMARLRARLTGQVRYKGWHIEKPGCQCGHPGL